MKAAEEMRVAPITREQIKIVWVFVPALFFPAGVGPLTVMLFALIVEVGLSMMSFAIASMEKLEHEGEKVERKASSWISSSFLSLHLMAMGTYRKVTANGHLIPL